ncbi:MAG: hypothetical protein AB1635_20200, partial [Acidobacteriota bacterium]
TPISYPAAAIWQNAVYVQELTEPFLANPRDVTYPLTRVWTRAQGGHAAALAVTAASAHDRRNAYALRDESGAILETGYIELDVNARPVSTIDLVPNGGAATRRGVYSVLDGEMRIDYGVPGAPRPSSLAGASVYRTP